MTQADKVVAIAQGEVGNAGGEKYWRWYGFDSRVSWCACFVSWVLHQACSDLNKYLLAAIGCARTPVRQLVSNFCPFPATYT